MRSLKTREAAGLLNVSPNTLRTWERKFGYPMPLRSEGRHRSYNHAEIVALRDALKRGLSIMSAISVVREWLGADTEALVGALDAFDLPSADRAMEASLALRSMERSVNEVLLPTLDDLRRRDGVGSTTWAVAHRWGTDWLNRAARLAPEPTGAGILIGDATAGMLSSAGPNIRALELFCRRGGSSVLVLPVEALLCLPQAIAAIEPRCVVIAGGHSSDEQVGRWAYSVRRLTGDRLAALYLRPVRAKSPDLASNILSGEPMEAHRQLVELISGQKDSKSADFDEATNPLAQSG
jgi:DNA-binding transcriptional MerR regulator